MAGMSQSEIDVRVEKAAKTLNLTEYLERKPGQLSGGQRQRIAIGRAIVREPKAFLFDEPLSNLDAALRVQMRIEIMQLHQTLGATMIYVTHDQVEAMTMADRIVVLNRGIIEQVGTPLELYNRPDSVFVAGFIGSPKMNLLSDNSLGIRPEHIGISEKEKAGAWKGRVALSEHLGADTFLHVDTDEYGRVVVRVEGEFSAAAGTNVWLTPDKKRMHRFDPAGKAIRS
jgi:multiple sugar transport system ATP-binding protein